MPKIPALGYCDAWIWVSRIWLAKNEVNRGVRKQTNEAWEEELSWLRSAYSDFTSCPPEFGINRLLDLLLVTTFLESNDDTLLVNANSRIVKELKFS